jgi:hypothetical protein
MRRVFTDSFGTVSNRPGGVNSLTTLALGLCVGLSSRKERYSSASPEGLLIAEARKHLCSVELDDLALIFLP